MVNVKQKERKKIWLNLDIQVLKRLTAYCRFKGYTRNKVIERVLTEYMEGKK